MKNRTTLKMLSAAAMVLLLNACGGGSSTESVDTSTSSISGILIDSPVEGVSYACGTVHQVTGQDGSFRCDRLPVVFSVGGVILGEIEILPRDGYVTPQDMLGVSRETYDDNVAKIALFLQSLDDDGEIENRITIEASMQERLREQNVTLDRMSESDLVLLLDQIDAVKVVSKDEALTHLYSNVSKLLTEEDVTEEDPSDPLPVEEANTTQEDEEIIITPPPVVETPDTNESATEIADIEEDVNITDEIRNEDVLDDAVKQAYLDAINDARAEGRECGDYGYFPATVPLTWSEELYNASLEHSRDMAISNTFSHTGSGTQSDITAEALHPGTGSSVGERIEYNGYTNWNRYGENIAAGTVMDEAVEAMDAWLDSPDHCKNIMNADFREVGMAVYYNEESHYSYYWTQDFGTR